MSFDLFLFGLLIVSVLTGLCTEAVKTIFKEALNKPYNANIVAIIASTGMSILVSAFYVVINSIIITPEWILYFIGLVIGSWLCATLGYDKVTSIFKSIMK